MNTNLQKKRNNNKLTIKETFEMKNPKMLKALSKILPDSFKEKKDKKKNKEKYFIKN
jgi:hypothetical protein